MENENGQLRVLLLLDLFTEAQNENRRHHLGDEEFCSEHSCGCVIHVAGDVNHSQEMCAVAQHWWPMGPRSVDSF